MIVALRSWWKRLISERICTRSLASRLESGSSIRKTRGVAHQRAAERHALLLAARELARLALEQMRHVEHLAPPPCTLLVDLGLGQLAHLQREGEVLVDRLLRVERVVLEHHRDVPVLGVEIVDHAVADDDVAAR